MTERVCTVVTDHFDRAMISANVQAFESTLLSHGYAAEDIVTLNRDFIEEVSWPWRKKASHIDGRWRLTPFVDS